LAPCGPHHRTALAPGSGYGQTRLRPHALNCPIVGAGLPGLVMACGGLLAWWRRRQKAA
jgi:hypothetical protein